MSCRNKHVIAWESFEIGNDILYTEDDVTDKWQKKTVSLNSSLLLFFLQIDKICSTMYIWVVRRKMCLALHLLVGQMSQSQNIF
jgi:hypothetical protein